MSRFLKLLAFLFSMKWRVRVDLSSGLSPFEIDSRPAVPILGTSASAAGVKPVLPVPELVASTQEKAP